jgi:hypothetical protein
MLLEIGTASVIEDVNGTNNGYYTEIFSWGSD